MIGNSELILNERGAVYHLDLRAEELAETVITVGDPGRVPAVSRYFDQLEFRRSHREFVTHTGRLGSRRISVLSTGIGTDNIDIVLSELDALVNIDLERREPRTGNYALQIIRLGTSGGLQADIPTDSCVISSAAIGLDNLLAFYSGPGPKAEAGLMEFFGEHTGLVQKGLRPYWTEGSRELEARFARLGFHEGITVTCPGFYGPQGRSLRLAPALPDLAERLSSFRFGNWRIANFEMETSALYGLGGLMGHQCLSISTVVANRVSRSFSRDPAGAVDSMIRHCLEALGSH